MLSVEASCETDPVPFPMWLLVFRMVMSRTVTFPSVVTLPRSSVKTSSSCSVSEIRKVSVCSVPEIFAMISNSSTSSAEKISRCTLSLMNFSTCASGAFTAFWIK